MVSTQQRRLEVQIKPRFWHPTTTRRGTFVDRSSTAYPLHLVTVEVRHALFNFGGFEQQLQVNNGANTVSLDRFLAELEVFLSAPDALPLPEADSRFLLILTPGQHLTGSSSAVGTDQFCVEPAGPRLAAPTATPAGQTFETQYRRIEVAFGLERDDRGGLKMVNPEGISGIVRGVDLTLFPNGVAVMVEQASKQILDLDWRVDWVRRVSPSRPKTQARPGGTLDTIVLHQTGIPGPAATSVHRDFPRMGGIVDGFTSSASTKGVHYVVDADGHVVKLGRDDEFMSQTGRSAWRTDTDITKRSIGIEHVQYTRNNGVLSEKQLAASVDLVSQLMFELSIPRRNVVAHADIRCVTATDDPNNARPIIQARLALGGHVLNPFDRKGCPGYQFPWAAYEEAGAALAPAEADGQNYGFFATNAGPMTPGLRHPDVLQAKQDLREIGWVFAPGNLDDRFDSIMVTVVRRFKARFASHLGLAVDISSFPPPEVDRATGELIKRVLRAATSPANG